MPFKFNSGAFWGLITVIFLFAVTLKIRKVRAERRWKKYDESQIYRPDEWEEKQREEQADTKGQSGNQGNKINSAADSGNNPAESGNEHGDTKKRRLGGNVGRKDISVSPGSVSKSNNAGIKKPFKAGKQSRVTIPDVEPIDE